jgi:oligosaccharide repeat unit polymerase
VSLFRKYIFHSNMIIRRFILGFVVAFTLALIGISFQKMNKTWTNPTSIMCYFWSIICFSAALRLFGLYDVSLTVWFIILAGIFSFAIGSNIKVRFNKKYEYCPKNEVSIEQFISPKMYCILFIIVGVYATRSLITSIRLMKSGYTLDIIRQATMGAQEINGYTFDSSAGAFYLRYFCDGLQAILIASGIEYFFSDTKKNFKYLIAVLYLTIADSFANGGRWIIVYTAIEFVVGYFLLRDRNGEKNIVKITRKAKVALIIVIFILIYVMDKVTTSRLSGGFAQHFYIYLCGCIPFLNSKLKFLSTHNYWTIIFSGQYGIWSFIAPYIYKLTGKYITFYSDAIQVIGTTQTYELIGTGQEYNAFVSIFYYLYADFRWIGVVLGMLLFGIVAGNVFTYERKSKQTGKMTGVVPYLVVVQMILKSIQSYPLAANSYVVTILLLILFYLFQNYRYHV